MSETSFPTSLDTFPAQATLAAGTLANVDGAATTHSSIFRKASSAVLALEKAAIGQVFNVKGHYGAVGDGSTDDTTAIQNALDAAKAAGGGVVYFPAGTYKITTGLTITVSADTSLPLVITGHGASLSTTAAIVMLKLSDTGTGNLRRITVSDMRFQVNNASAVGLQTRGAAYCQFDRLDFSGVGTGMDLGSGAAADLGLQVDEIRITAPGRGILLNGQQCALSNIVIGEGISGADAINLSGTGNVINGFTVRGNGGTGGSGAVVLANGATQCALVGGYVSDSYSVGVHVGTGRGNKLVGVTIVSSQTHGLLLNGSLQFHGEVILHNNSVAGVGSGDHCRIDSTATDCTVFAHFTGTDPTNDFNETNAGASNNRYVARSQPNGNTFAGTGRCVETSTTFALPSGTNFGIFGSTATTKPTITGSRGGNAALASLLTGGATLGLWTDSTSA